MKIKFLGTNSRAKMAHPHPSINSLTPLRISDSFVIDLLSFMPKFEDNQSVMNPNLVYL